MLHRLFFTKSALLILAITAYFLAFGFGLSIYPAVAMDEPWLSFFAADVWGNYPHDGLHAGVHQLFQVYPFFLALWQNCFGISLISIRAFSVLIGFLSGVVFNKTLSQL